MSQEKLRILLVEDSAIAARLITLLIREGMPDDNYYLHSGSNLTDAIEAYKCENLQIVLLESGLLESRGLKPVKHSLPDIPTFPLLYLPAMRTSRLLLKLFVKEHRTISSKVKCTAASSQDLSFMHSREEDCNMKKCLTRKS